MGLTDEVVTILVGSDEKPFYVHKALLCSRSEFFRAAFGGLFKEATEKQVRLPDEDPELFPQYLLWVYNQNITLRAGLARGEFDMDGWCHLFVLAEKLGSGVLQNKVIDALCWYISAGEDKELKSESAHFVWDTTLPGSVLRKILVDLMAYDIYFGEAPDLVEAPSQVLYDVLVVCTHRLPHRLDDEIAPFDKDYNDRCKRYHTHGAGETCVSGSSIMAL
ncbi:MAG: hypothetical protein Q9218_001842 [Villophora microphyllina]